MRNKLKAGLAKKEDLAIASIFGKLKTNIDFSFIDNKHHLLVVTSALPNEGKTTISVNTAVAMAASDKKTLILDADMRNPSVHLLFNYTNSKGLSDIISTNSDWRQYIIKPKMPNLYVITAGRQPVNPAKFLSSDRFRNLMAELSEEFDYIIIDTPPVLLVPDPQIVASIADGVILVIKNGKTPVKALKEAKVTLNRANVNLIGAVLNEVRAKDSLYGYGAGYTYGAERIDKQRLTKTRVPSASSLTKADKSSVQPSQKAAAPPKRTER